MTNLLTPGQTPDGPATAPTSPLQGPTVEAPSRRNLLRVAGIGGLVAAGALMGTQSAAAGTPAAAAPSGVLPMKKDEPDDEVLVATSVAQLVGWKAKKIDDGTVVQLLGRSEERRVGKECPV